MMELSFHPLNETEEEEMMASSFCCISWAAGGKPESICRVLLRSFQVMVVSLILHGLHSGVLFAM